MKGTKYDRRGKGYAGQIVQIDELGFYRRDRLFGGG